MRTISIAVVISFLIVINRPSPAQTAPVSQIAGTVQDTSGAPVPDADVRITQTQTGLIRTVKSGTDGTYVLPDLPVGPYELQVEKQGFERYLQTGIVLQVSSNPEINVTLQLGTINQQVEVNAAAAMVETHNTGVGQVIDSRSVVDLPLNGREALQLVQLSGAVTPAPSYDLNGSKNYPEPLVLSVAGGQPNGITFLLDGGLYNDVYNNLTLPLPFPDALQEFKLETSALPAQYGYHSTGAVNIVTKSGTNQFHGDAFEFVRNFMFNSRNAYALSRDTLKRNQFGGTIGGPIVRNKLFFFAGYQRTIVKTNPTSNISVVPTQAMLDGNFSVFASPACQGGKQVNLGAPFVNNQVSPTLFSPAALNILKYIPVSTNPCGTYTYGIPGNNDEHLGVGKIDYQLSERHSLFARYTFALYDSPGFFNGTDALTTTKAVQNDKVESFVIGDTYLIGPNTIASSHASLNRTVDIRDVPRFFGPSGVGINVDTQSPGWTWLAITGGFTLSGGPVNPGYFNTTAIQLGEDINLQRGNHQLAFGADWVHGILNSQIASYANGMYSFTGQITGLGLADFLLGDLANIQQSNIEFSNVRNDYFGLYAQDSWKVNRRLMINAGVRWEPFFPIYNKNDEVSHFDPTWFAEGLHSTVHPNAPAGLLFSGDPGMPANSYSFGTWNDFAPRIGMVLDPKGDGRATVRASYGIFYDPIELQFPVRFAFNPPYGASVNLADPPGGLANPYLGYPGGDPFPGLENKQTFPLEGVYINMPLHSKQTYVEQWNIDLQKQFGSSWLVSAGYLGNHMVHGWDDTEENPAVYFPGTCGTTACSTTANTNQRRILYLENPAVGQYYGSITNVDEGATSNYNGLLLSVQHRMSKHFSALANYTWSHCLSDPIVSEPGGTGLGYVNPNDRNLDYGNCAQDVRQYANITFIAEAPHFANAWEQRILGDWRLSTIMSLHTGLYYTVTTGVDNELQGVPGSGLLGERPNAVLADPYTSNGGLNRAAFTAPAPGMYGTSGVFNVHGPGFFDVDLALSRLFPIRESQNIEVRGEVFNVENRTNGIYTNLTLNSSLFGVINSANDPRIMQFALKYNF